MSLGLWSLGKSGKKSIVLEIKYLFQAVPIFFESIWFPSVPFASFKFKKKGFKKQKKKETTS